MPTRKNARRKRRFIDQKQQVRFAVEVGLYTVLFPLVFLIVALGDHFATWLIGANVESIHPLLREVIGFCFSHWWAVFLALGFVGYVSVWFSHKLFGPVYRFETALRQKQENPSQQIYCQLRRGDYFQDFSRAFEEFLNQYQPLESGGSTMEEKEVKAEETEVDGSAQG
jgi:hypothetical protein